MSFLFQRLLRSERNKTDDRDRDRQILSEIRDLKAAMIQSIDEKSAREVAKSVLKYRRLLDFLGQMRMYNSDVSLDEDDSDFSDLLEKFGVQNIVFESIEGGRMPQVILIMSSALFLVVRVSPGLFDRFSQDWGQFRRLDKEIKAAVIDSLADVESRNILIRRYDENYEQYRWERSIRRNTLLSQNLSHDTTESLGDILSNALKRSSNDPVVDNDGTDDENDESG